jgi:hypothetical protein
MNKDPLIEDRYYYWKPYAACPDWDAVQYRNGEWYELEWFMAIDPDQHVWILIPTPEELLNKS